MIKIKYVKQLIFFLFLILNMIKGVRNIRDKKKSQNKQINLTNQQRENNWDDRFFLGNIKDQNRNNQNNSNFQIPKPKKN